MECIAKARAHTNHEFGTKTSIATTDVRTNVGQFILGLMPVPGSPYDGHTIQQQIDQVERLTGVAVERGYADLGYRGNNLQADAEVYLPRDRRVTSPALKREGADGDGFNAILCAIGHNMRLLAAWLKALWRALITLLENHPRISLAAA